MSEEFAKVEVFTGQEQAPEGPKQITAAPSTMATVEQARAIAETQSALVIARANPRDEQVSYMKIIKACKRRSLAEVAKYAYRRGPKLVEGETVKLLAVIAQAWGNIDFGFRELAREGDKSEVEAYAWDLETNTRAKRTFQVRHYRDVSKEKGGGTVRVEGERDTYELVAGLAQRRVRSCLENVIPSDIIKGASAQCDETIKKGDGRPIEDQVRDMLVAFDALGVTKDMIEAWLQHKTSAIVPAQIVQLKQIYRSIKDGVAPREDFFSVSAAPVKTKDEKKAPPTIEDFDKLAMGRTDYPDPELDKYLKEMAAAQEPVMSVEQFKVESVPQFEEMWAHFEARGKAKDAAGEPVTGVSGPWDETVWKNLRKPGFPTHIYENLSTFKDVPVKIQAKVIRKWDSFFPDTPFPTVETQAVRGKEPEQDEEVDTKPPLSVEFVGLKKARENLGDDVYKQACEAFFTDGGEPTENNQARMVVVKMNQIAETATADLGEPDGA